MNPLIWATHAAVAASLAATVMAIRRGPWVRQLSLAAAALAGVSLVFLATRFLAADVQYTYVFLYTRADLPWWYRLAGTWAGREGSLLLWATFVSVCAAIWARMPHHRMHVLLGAAATAFLAAAAWQTPYAPTPAFFLEGRPGGNGLNPTLLSPFIIIHPPIMFAAYALTTVPAASAFAHLLGGAPFSSYRLASRLNLALYTAAMGLGGVWAYYTLGFGGYWAWDPVEVANLLPWLALVVYLHAERHHYRHGRYAVAGPLLAVLPFLLTLLSTISTRSGLWVSVHAFTDPSNTFNPDPAARFLDILQAEPGLVFFVGALLFVLFAFLALWCRHLAAAHATMPVASRAIAGALAALAGVALVAPMTLLGFAFEAASVVGLGYGLLGLLAALMLAAAAPALVKDSDGPSMRRLGIPALVYVAVIVLGLGLVVLFLFHMASVLGWSEAFYASRLPWIATPAIVAITIFMARPWAKAKALHVAGAVLAAALLSALVDPRAYLLVLAAGGTFVALERVHHASSAHRGKAAIGDRMLLAAAVLNILFWLSPPAAWSLMWPAQFWGGAASILCLVLVLNRNAGRYIGPRWLAPALCAGLLGFGVSPILALGGFLGTRATFHPTRLKHASIAGIHAAVLLMLVGFGAQAFAWEAEGELGVGQQLVAGDWQLEYLGSDLAGNVFADEVRPRFETMGEEASATLYWEKQTASHYPLPATVRTWWADAYWNVEAVCTDPTGTCGPDAWTQAFQSGPRIRADAEIAKVEVRFEVIPGVGLVWSGVSLLVVFLSLLILHEPTPPPSPRSSPARPSP